MSIRKFETHQPITHSTCYVDETALVIGNVEIGEDSSIWPMCVVRGDVNAIKIGNRTNIQDASVLHVTHEANEYSAKVTDSQSGYPLIIGDDVTVGHKALLHACTIHNRVLVGMGSIIMDGVIVEADTIVAAGSLVPPHKVLESGYLWVGSPVKQARELTLKEKNLFKIFSRTLCAFERAHRNELSITTRQHFTPKLKPINS